MFHNWRRCVGRGGRGTILGQSRDSGGEDKKGKHVDLLGGNG